MQGLMPPMYAYPGSSIGAQFKLQNAHTTAGENSNVLKRESNHCINRFPQEP
jgi:hypothetical protein